MVAVIWATFLKVPSYTPDIYIYIYIYWCLQSFGIGWVTISWCIFDGLLWAFRDGPKVIGLQLPSENEVDLSAVLANMVP